MSSSGESDHAVCRLYHEEQNALDSSQVNQAVGNNRVLYFQDLQHRRVIGVIHRPAVKKKKSRMNHVNDEELKWPTGFRVFFFLCRRRHTAGKASLNVTHTHLLLVSWQLGRKGLVMIWGLWPVRNTLLIMPFSTLSSLWLSQVKACSSPLRHSSTARANSGTFRLIR